MKGKSISQRVIELSQIAHLDFRAELIKAAKKNYYIFTDHLPPLAEDLIFIGAYKSKTKLKNGKALTIRPHLPSDELDYRNFFYSLKQETIFLRFFAPVSAFSGKWRRNTGPVLITGGQFR